MRLLEFLAQVFINTFGITQPSESQRRRVSLVLGGFLLTMLVGIAAATAFLLWQMPGSR